MTIYIAFLRGINVGGKNPLPMKELVAVLEDLGSQNVNTFIQSGNAVFGSRDKDASRLSKMISAEIKKRCGFESHVLLLKLKDLERAIKESSATRLNPTVRRQVDHSLKCYDVLCT
jgi:uncharacterized protein (DUF1697 family)